MGIAGHFTQLVWAASRLLGVGLAKSATGRQSPTKQMVQSKSTIQIHFDKEILLRNLTVDLQPKQSESTTILAFLKI